MDRYAVFGNPVGHSLSPRIHARFGDLTGDRIDYRAVEVPIGGFAAFVRAFFDSGARGGNVTLPFKIDAFEMARHRSERATLAGAANFLHVRDGEIHADNTDGAGLVADLAANLGRTLQGTEILLVGAGGASRGVIAPLLACNPRRLVIANRTAEKARELARRFAKMGQVEGVALDAIPRGGYAIVINATSTSTQGTPLELPSRVFEAGALAYDMMYGPKAESFLSAAKAAGAAKASDGLGMLVEQAAESFFLWRGQRPPTGPVLSELRAKTAG
jgi:shikimate dehydrogenase